jgi:hypothetical protein
MSKIVQLVASEDEGNDYLRFELFAEEVQTLAMQNWEYLADEINTAIDTLRPANIEHALMAIDHNLGFFEDFDKRAARARQEKEYFVRAELWDVPPSADGRTVISRNEVKRQVLLLVDSFPTATIPNLKVFLRSMIDEIHVKSPNPIILEAACRKMRRTLKKVPTIAEVMEALAATDDKWSPYWDLLEDGLGWAGYYKNQAQNLRDWLDFVRNGGVCRANQFNEDQELMHATFGACGVVSCSSKGVDVAFDDDSIHLNNRVPPHVLTCIGA